VTENPYESPPEIEIARCSMTSRPSTAAPILAGPAIVLVKLEIA
jgi:hypothetical protein